MCGGGGGSRATITQPDYKAMNGINQRMFDAMNEAQDNPITEMQGDLNNRLSRLNTKTEKLRDAKVANAKVVSAEEARITAMIGTPPPAEAAKAPVLGDSRTRVTKSGRGRTGMRARRRAPLQVSPGRT